MRFTVTEDFYSEEMASGYVGGMTYEVLPDNEKLMTLVRKWIDEGLVTEGGPEAQVEGRE